jgi:signal peptidase I
MFGSRKRHAFYKRRSSLEVAVRGVLKTVILVFVLVVLARTFIVQTYRVESSSMSPALNPGDRVIAFPLAYGSGIPFTSLRLPGIGSPDRGDVVVVTPPYHRPEITPVRLLNPLIRFLTGDRYRIRRKLSPDWDRDTIVKRVLGVPGDTVRFQDHLAYIRPEDSRRYDTEFAVSRRTYDVLIEPPPDGWRPGDPVSGTTQEVTLGPDEYFLVGDHRSVSLDSRSWGTVSRENIHVRIMLRYWPIHKLAVF